MASSSIATSVKLRHSQTGKMDVVKGALAVRLKLREKFLRRSQTVKSYGTLITVPWNEEGMRWFPNAIADGAVELEEYSDGLCLKVIDGLSPRLVVLSQLIDWP